MNIIVTCGPSYEPIDQARRITNFSTGRLGILLSNALTDRGWRVYCLKGESATCPDPVSAHQTQVFTTNQDLAGRLETLARQTRVDAVLHAAALCDFVVARVLDAEGREIASPKFPTRAGRLRLDLAPAMKVLPRLRGWFPRARIVGWKYELAGTRAEAFDRAKVQLHECQTDACVLNGAAYGTGFAVCRPDGGVVECADPPALVNALIELLEPR